MIEKWYSSLKLPLTFEQFAQLPQNRAYKYEYWDDQAWLTPRPQSHHAMLDLASFARPIAGMATEEALAIRPLADEDWDRLPPLFAAAFHRVQPFASLADAARLRAAQECLQETRKGAEGPLVLQASLVAVRPSDGALIGAFLTTLSPDEDPAEWHSWHWQAPPPSDAVVRRMGRPHLTWIFVGPWHARLGVGTALLDAAVQAMLPLGYCQLASTFLLGNESSTLWHWRVGFRLLPYPGSRRSIR
jgi:hypothetical protein